MKETYRAKVTAFDMALGAYKVELEEAPTYLRVLWLRPESVHPNLRRIGASGEAYYQSTPNRGWWSIRPLPKG